MIFTDSEQHFKPAVEAVRTELMDGRAGVQDFAQGINKSPRSVWAYIAQGMPVEYIGRTPFVVVKPAIEWLRKRKVSRLAAPRGRGRPRKAA
jgi:hypothetical protein